jgi:hypothetical protein
VTVAVHASSRGEPTSDHDDDDRQRAARPALAQPASPVCPRLPALLVALAAERVRLVDRVLLLERVLLLQWVLGHPFSEVSHARGAGGTPREKMHGF